MIKYHQESINIDALKENNIDRIQLQMVPEGSRVLEIGCATGYMSDYLQKEKGCTVLGIEPVVEQAESAMAKGISVFTGFIDAPAVREKIDQEIKHNGPFDVLFMSQVIEHIAEPEIVLRQIQNWLSPTGILIISTCNIAHWKCRLRLLGGKWDYDEYGVFDKGHLRFFTIKSFREMLIHCGYSITDFNFTFEDICPFKILFDTRILAPSDILRLIPFIGNSLRQRYTRITKNFIATQFVFQAKIQNGKTQ